MSFLKSINTYQINDLIKSGSQRIILFMPGLFLETVKVVIDKFQSGFKHIKVIINCSEKIIRQGYGEIEAIQKLRNAGVPVFDQPDNLVSFIIVDNIGYFLFPQSRIFLEQSHQVRNAIAMDPFTMEQLIGIFFPPEPREQKQFEDKLSNALILSSQRINKIEEILGESKSLQILQILD